MKIEETTHLRKCRSCRYFVEFANDKYAGWCHKNAPLPLQRGTELKDEFRQIFDSPKVLSCFWCGQYESC